MRSEYKRNTYKMVRPNGHHTRVFPPLNHPLCRPSSSRVAYKRIYEGDKSSMGPCVHLCRDAKISIFPTQHTVLRSTSSLRSRPSHPKCLGVCGSASVG